MGKADTVIEAAESQIGSPYVFGAWGGLCTPSLRRKYLSYNPSHTAIERNCQVLSGKASSCAGCRFEGMRCFDCRGFTHWCLEQVGIDITGGTVTNQWKGDNWETQGEIETMPNVVCCVFQKKPGVNTFPHTGLHVGGGRIIHCSGEVKEGSTSDSGWTHYAIPRGLYTEEEIEGSGVVPLRISKGDSGDKVKELQRLLNLAGFNCGTVDGKFGTKTDAALRAFQTAVGFYPDGVATDDVLDALRSTQGKQNDTSGTTDLCLPTTAAEALYEALRAKFEGVD